VRSIPISTNIAIAAPPWTFIAHAFALNSKSRASGTK
jgi:hypothetical protein